MLVLSRKAGQAVSIGEDITLTVIRVSSGQVRIGITAPRDLPIVRQELSSRAPATSGLAADVCRAEAVVLSCE